MLYVVATYYGDINGTYCILWNQNNFLHQLLLVNIECIVKYIHLFSVVHKLKFVFYLKTCNVIFFSKIIHQLIERKQAEIRKVHPGLTYFNDTTKPTMNIKDIPGICKLQIHTVHIKYVCTLMTFNIVDD